ncbi:MAG: molybdate ABC transporter substrate-binding protein [Planctomycetes bacterium]|nr:molybdate ABC transporter substrate-binding protein [Planctomycetota bacterium]
MHSSFVPAPRANGARCSSVVRQVARAVLALLLLTVFAAAQVPPAPAPKPAAPLELDVYAAASLREALTELGKTYERDHAVKLVFNFGSSTDLARQIVAGNQADLFLSADEKELDKVAEEKLLDDASRASVLGNQLVVVEAIDPKDAAKSFFTQPFTVDQLARPEVKLLALADTATVPAGRYAKAWLEKKELWKTLEARVLPGLDVRATLASIESGAAQAGIVYRTDAAVSKRVRVVHAVPLDEGPRIVYGFAALAKRPHVAEARALLEFLRSADARKVFEARGFVALPSAKPEAKPAKNSHEKPRGEVDETRNERTSEEADEPLAPLEPPRALVSSSLRAPWACACAGALAFLHRK